jgi:two-component system response regulator YesN
MDGFEALQEFQREPFDLVVTDYRMPGMNGLEMVQAMRRTRPAMQVIVVTGDDHISLSREAQALGIHCILKKPVYNGYLLKVVRKVFDAAALPPSQEDE